MWWNVAGYMFRMCRCTVLLCKVLVWLAVCSPGLVLDLFPHWGHEESPDAADWSQYEVMHCLQNQCPQLVETGSFRMSWHRTQQDSCCSTETWLLFLSLWRHFFMTKMICWLLEINIKIWLRRSHRTVKESFLFEFSIQSVTSLFPLFQLCCFH